MHPLGLKAPLPESPRTLILRIGAPCDVLTQAAVKPANAAESLPINLYLPGVTGDGVDLKLIGLSRTPVHPAQGKEPEPSLSYVLRAELRSDVGSISYEGMKVVRHNGVGGDFYAEDLGETA